MVFCNQVCEFLARKIQMFHDLGAGGGAGTPGDDLYLLLGTYESCENIGICLEVTTFLGLSVAQSAIVDKERRRAQEDRALPFAERKKDRNER